MYVSAILSSELSLYRMQKVWMRHLPELGLVGGPVAGMVCIVTGPTSGIGTETASELARRGAHGTCTCFR